MSLTGNSLEKRPGHQARVCLYISDVEVTMYRKLAMARSYYRYYSGGNNITRGKRERVANMNYGVQGES